MPTISPPSSSDSDTESSTTNYGHIADEAAHVKYDNGQLSWSGGVLRDEDIIAVTKVEGNNIGHTIWSLAQVEVPSESNPKPRPFELRTTSATNLPENFLEKFLLKSLPSYLDAESDVYVLISTLSGTGLAPAFFDEILQPLLSSIGLKESRYHVVRTSSAESVSEFARSVLLVGANNNKKQTVVMLSGDGGIVDTINGILGSGDRSKTFIKPVLSQLPLGTGNALFHSLHKPSTIPSIYIQGLQTLLRGKPRSLPILKAKFSPGARLLTNESQTATPLPNNTLYGAVVASYGLHSTLVADSDTTEYRKHGAKRFGLVANDLLNPGDGKRPHAYRADVTLFKADGKEEKISRKEHGYILTTLVSNLEKPFTISPASKPLDGQLRVVHFGALSGEQTMNIMKEAYNNGNHTSLEEVAYEPIEGLRLDFREEGDDWKWRRCCIDGLTVGIEEGGWMEVHTVTKVEDVVDVLVDI